MRTFKTGATRGDEHSKLDHEGFESPFVRERFARYMQGHRIQADGEARDSDNWQKGMDKESYIKALVRHTQDAHLIWRGGTVIDPETRKEVDIEDLLCAIVFNANGLLFETLIDRGNAVRMVGEENDEESSS